MTASWPLPMPSVLPWRSLDLVDPKSSSDHPIHRPDDILLDEAAASDQNAALALRLGHSLGGHSIRARRRRRSRRSIRARRRRRSRRCPSRRRSRLGSRESGHACSDQRSLVEGANDLRRPRIDRARGVQLPVRVVPLAPAVCGPRTGPGARHLPSELCPEAAAGFARTRRHRVLDLARVGLTASERATLAASFIELKYL